MCAAGTAKDVLVIAATDLEVALRVQVPQVEVKKTGELLVPADKLMSIARESIDETLTLEADEQTCHVRGQDSHYEIYGQNPKEFPPVPELEGSPDIQIDAAHSHGADREDTVRGREGEHALRDQRRSVGKVGQKARAGLDGWPPAGPGGRISRAVAAATIGR